MLSSNNAIWLSKNGKRMVYASFDDRQVDNMEYSLYGQPGNTHFQYPITNNIRYPKVNSKKKIIQLEININIVSYEFIWLIAYLNAALLTGCSNHHCWIELLSLGQLFFDLNWPKIKIWTNFDLQKPKSLFVFLLEMNWD